MIVQLADTVDTVGSNLDIRQFGPERDDQCGNGLGVVQKTIQDRARRWHVTQELAPFLQRPIAGHDGGAIFIPAHDHIEKMLAGVPRQLFEAKIIDELKASRGHI